MGFGVGIIVGYMWRLYFKRLVFISISAIHNRKQFWIVVRKNCYFTKKNGHYFVATIIAKKSTLDFQSVTEIN